MTVRVQTPRYPAKGYKRSGRPDEYREYRRYDLPEKWHRPKEHDAGELDSDATPIGPGLGQDVSRETWHGIYLFLESIKATDYAELVRSQREHRNRLKRAIEQSRRILELDDDWDEEGSSAYSKEVWDTAVRFLEALEGELMTLGKMVDPPRILPGPEGSIDLHWKTNAFEILMKVPSDAGLITFFGDDYSKCQIEGTIPIGRADYAALVLCRFSKK